MRTTSDIQREFDESMRVIKEQVAKEEAAFKSQQMKEFKILSLIFALFLISISILPYFLRGDL